MIEFPEELWGIFDSRTGERATVASFLTEHGAREQIKEWKVRDGNGLRQDVHDLLPFLEVRPLTPIKRY